MLTSPSYSPDRFLSAIAEKLGVIRDCKIAVALGTNPQIISKVRHKTVKIGATLLIAAHQETDISIAELKALAGMPPAVKVLAEC